MAKRLTSIFVTLLAALLLVTGCTNGSGSSKEGAAPESITKGFSCDAVISYNSMDISAHITRPSAGVCRIEITDPIPLTGLVMDWTGENFEVTYMGIKVPFNTSILPDSGFASGIVNVLETAAQNTSFEVTKSDEETFYSATSDSGQFKIAFSNIDGSLTGLSVPSINLDVKISGFSNMGE